MQAGKNGPNPAVFFDKPCAPGLPLDVKTGSHDFIVGPARSGQVTNERGSFDHHVVEVYKISFVGDWLAMSSYQAAIETSGDWDEDVKKLALYRAGKLAKGLKDFATSEGHLSELAGMDYGFKNVSALLDEVMRLNSEPSAD